MSKLKIITNGIIKDNPTFILVLGMCPTIGTTTSAINGMGMGLATTFVLILSNVFISLLAKMIPDKVRIPAYIVIIASFSSDAPRHSPTRTPLPTPPWTASASDSDSPWP